jgi:predicted RNA binding protein YcfA (HicA-like mRNA interferase family)
LFVTLAPVTSRDVIRALKDAGWRLVHVVGDHLQFKHPVHPGRVTVPHPTKDLDIKVIKSIEKQAGIKLRR